MFVYNKTTIDTYINAAFLYPSFPIPGRVVVIVAVIVVVCTANSGATSLKTHTTISNPLKSSCCNSNSF